MSVRIKVSYERQQELERVLKVLKPIMTSYKVSKEQNGRFKRAYVVVK